MNTSNDRENSLHELLFEISNSLDITQAQYDTVIDRYTAVAEYLAAEDSPLQKYSPDIRPQGSFILGTMIKPIVEEDELDVDLVFRLNGKEKTWTQKDVKDLVGQQLKKSKRYKAMLDEEGNRCWTLRYHEEAKFHMDILPAIIEESHLKIFNKSFDSILESKEVDVLSISITDLRLPNYDNESNTLNWLKSNPWGYAAWFKDRANISFRKAIILNEAIEPIPPQTTNKDPLVCIVQILKRHRDIMFGGDEEKPISIIITTLAAHAYNGEVNLLAGIRSVLSKMRNFISIEADLMNSRTIHKIANPVIPKENFADKWSIGKRKDKFYEWLDKATSDFDHLLNPGIEVNDYLVEILGTRTVNEAIKKAGLSNINEQVVSVQQRGGIVTGAITHKQKPQWPQLLTFQVHVHARYKDGKGKSKTIEKATKVPKDSDIYFIAETNVSKPFDVYWQVVNTGREAELAGDLRGQIFHSKTAGAGGLSQKETARYAGTHWIECFIVQNNICVARSQEFWITIS